MELFIYVCAALALIVIAAILVINRRESAKQLPEPQLQQPVVDNHLQVWVFIRPLKNGMYLFRSPQGRMTSITLSRCEYLGFCRQFDFKSIQK